MKYFDIKRYNFSTIIKNCSKTLDSFLNFFKIISIKKINSYFAKSKHVFNKTLRRVNLKEYKILSIFKKKFRRINLGEYKISNILKKIKFKKNDFLFFHLPSSIIFFSILYLVIPAFYNYEITSIENLVCKNQKFNCYVEGKISYKFFPSPRLKIKDLKIKLPSNKKENLAIIEDAQVKLSIKNLLSKDKHKIKSITFNKFDGNINLKKLKNYIILFEKDNLIPINFKNGRISLYDNKNYIASIEDANLNIKFLEDSSTALLKGKFLNDNLEINLNRKKINKKTFTDIKLKMKKLNFFTKASFIFFDNNVFDGNFLIKQGKNKFTGIFDYKDDKIMIKKSNVRNSFVDGKLLGEITLSPYFEFNLDLSLNSINFTKLYSYFLFLDIADQKKLFKINKIINGKINVSADKVYSKHNLVKSFESRLKFYNGSFKIEQFLINLGKLGAADILGIINNNNKFNNFKFESNVFVDNKKKFLSKFGIYDKNNLSSNLFISGNFDFKNIKVSLYEIFDNEKFTTEDTNFIESEFNDLMLDKDFENLFNFPKFKVFLKSIREENN